MKHQRPMDCTIYSPNRLDYLWHCWFDRCSISVIFGGCQFLYQCTEKVKKKKTEINELSPHFFRHQFSKTDLDVCVMQKSTRNKRREEKYGNRERIKFDVATNQKNKQTWTIFYDRNEKKSSTPWLSLSNRTIYCFKSTEYVLLYLTCHGWKSLVNFNHNE